MDIVVVPNNQSQLSKFDPCSYKPRIRFEDHQKDFIPYWRTAADGYRKECQVTRQGMDTLLLSGSGQFSSGSVATFADRLKKVENFDSRVKKIVVINLRRENHVDGHINGSGTFAIAWKVVTPIEGRTGYVYNEDASVEEIEAQEDLLGKSLVGITKTYDTDLGDQEMTTAAFMVEKELVKKLEKELGLLCEYVRLPSSDEQAPDNATVQILIDMFNKRPDTDWWHFHCAGGQGRTTTFMCMVDMLCNNQKLTADEIILRQFKLGGSDMGDFKKDPHKLKELRYQFLKNFHQYCLECSKETPPYQTKWTNWREAR